MLDPLHLFDAVPTSAPITADVTVESWTLQKPFVIARGTQTEIQVPVVSLHCDGHAGRGESCPVPYFGESLDGVMSDIHAMLASLQSGTRWSDLHDRVPAGAARNAVDCALWDLAAKTLGKRAHELAGISPMTRVQTVFTISLDSPQAMATAASATDGLEKLKIKLGGRDGQDAERIRMIRAAVPEKTLIVDVNEGWDEDQLGEMMPLMAELGIAMLEQPLHAQRDGAVGALDHVVPVGADESCHVSADLCRVAPLYDVVNIKLDKTGGLTEALRLLRQAQGLGLETMVGCMLGTSLAMAPAMIVAQQCKYVDLDAPLLIGADRDHALDYSNGWVSPPYAALWG